VITVLLVRWIGGWTEASDFNASGRRREAALGLGAQQSEAEALRVAREQLVTFRDARDEIGADPRPMDDDDMPWWAYRVGDYVVAADWHGNPTDQRVISLGAALDDNGALTFSAGLKDRILGDRERAEQALKKFSNGTLRGSSKVATPVGAVGKRNTPPPPSGGGGN
jgi:hypothetical protein